MGSIWYLNEMSKPRHTLFRHGLLNFDNSTISTPIQKGDPRTSNKQWQRQGTTLCLHQSIFDLSAVDDVFLTILLSCLKT